MLGQFRAKQALAGAVRFAAGPTWNEPEPVRAPTKPITPAASTINGNGTARKKMPIKARPASSNIAWLLSARLPTRCTAWSTIASTAAFRPKKNAATAGTLPKAA
jgi:hypothetical protein